MYKVLPSSTHIFLVQRSLLHWRSQDESSPQTYSVWSGCSLPPKMSAIHPSLPGCVCCFLHERWTLMLLSFNLGCTQDFLDQMNVQFVTFWDFQIWNIRNFLGSPWECSLEREGSTRQWPRDHHMGRGGGSPTCLKKHLQDESPSGEKGQAA